MHLFLSRFPPVHAESNQTNTLRGFVQYGSADAAEKRSSRI
jgi:hypothetical protein